jgi:hypothetical protein
MTADTRPEPSVRAGLIACSAVSLLALWIAALEMPMADLPSGFMFFPVLPLTALGFVACCLWSTFQLTRIRRYGARFAAPLVICALTLAALAWAPFTQIWLQGNFLVYRADRERIVARVESGELVPNVAHSRNLIALGNTERSVSAGGNDIVVDQTSEGTYVLFLTLRGFRHYFSGFLHVPPGGDPAKFFEFEDAPPKLKVRYGKDWYFVAN